MLAEEVFVQQFGLHRFGVREKAQRFAGQPNQVLKNDGVMDSIIHGLTPGEWAMAGDEDAGAMQGVATGKGFNDDIAGIHFVIFFDLASVEAPSARNRPMKIICVSGAKSGNWAATLRPGSGKKAVRVNDAANLAKSAIKDEMSRSIGAGLQGAFDDFSTFERNDDHVPGFHRGVGDARRLDYNVAAGAINATDVAPGLDDQPLAYELQVGGADLLF